MELKRYLMIIWRWWWLVTIALVAAIIGSVVFTYLRPLQYQTAVRLIVSPAKGTTVDLNEVRASLSMLDKPVIANTYAEIAQSASIVQGAFDKLGIPTARRSSFTINASVLQKTGILDITVTGPDPAQVQQVAATISELTMTYVTGLYEAYDLKLLDPATLPLAPTNLDEKLNLALGVVLGLGAGILLAFLAEYLQTPLLQMEQASIVDVQTGAYKDSYFLRRVREEISRARRVQRPFVVGMMGLENFKELTDDLPSGTRKIILKQVVTLLKQILPEEDLMAEWRGGTLALLMPDCDPDAAQQTFKRLQSKLAWTPLQVGDTGFKLNLTASFGLVEYDLNGVGPEELLDRAEKALQESRA
jgi:diguanylate cyclase (GGDEF)-like protein